MTTAGSFSRRRHEECKQGTSKFSTHNKSAHGDPVPRERGDWDAIRTAIEADIRSGRWGVGQRMPTERALVARFAAARNTVRRALRALETQGVIVRNARRGNFIVSSFDDKSVSTAALVPANMPPADIIECRLHIEPSIIPIVVARAGATDFDRMLDCLERIDRTETVAEFENWDIQFHDALAQATRNAVIILLARMLARARHQSEWGELKARGTTAKRKMELQKQHYALLTALKSRDIEKAQRLLRHHLTYVKSYLLGDHAL
jgi:DNA-binding FadR family transcriptional regulator